MLFENNNVLHQLRCGGVLEAVRISCAGFPTKTPYPDFVDHFWNLVPELLSNEQLDDMALSKAVLKKANLQGYQCGLNKVAMHRRPYIGCKHSQSQGAEDRYRAAPSPGLQCNTVPVILFQYWIEALPSRGSFSGSIHFVINVKLGHLHQFPCCA